MKKLLYLCLVSISFLVVGCSHGLRITNLNEHFSPPPPSLISSPIIGIKSSNDVHAQNSKYISAIVDSLKRTGGFEKVIYPYNQSLNNEVDVILELTVIPEYSGEGSNFFVNWPGFIIFAPAIWGYGYTADIHTIATATYPYNNSSHEILVDTKYNFRQAEIDRTWTELGWLEIGIIPLIGGIAFIQYDVDVTNKFIAEVSNSYGPFVANKIIASISQNLTQPNKANAADAKSRAAD